MPTYEYRCKECSHEFETVQSFSDDALTECPSCGGPLRKLFGNVGIAFKGSGFYKNDSRASAGNGSKSSSSEGSDSSDGSGSSKTDSSDSKSSSDSKTSSGSSESSGSSSTSDTKSSGSTGDKAKAAS